MVTSSRVFASDEELGKKDDDYRVGGRSRLPLFWRKRRIFGVLVGCVLLYLFVHNIPTDLGPVDRRFGRGARPPNAPGSAGWQYGPGQQLHSPGGMGSEYTEDEHTRPSRHQAEQQNYDGPIKFLELASSLKRYQSKHPGASAGRSVLFAASSLSGISTLIALACQMSSLKKNIVHIAVLGRDTVSLEEIRALNNVDQDSCNIWWHDARPDYASSSSNVRMLTSVGGAARHLVTYLDPKAVITLDPMNEDVFFTKALSAFLAEAGATHIEIPTDAMERIGWMARLDANSLRAWHTAGIDIHVSVPQGATASLVRLLKSLAHADYSGFEPPRLTVELPADPDPRVLTFLRGFQWPPLSAGNLIPKFSQLIVTRRIKEQKIYEEEASMRFVESFYPANPLGPHLLVLSPQAELSPAFFHYLKLHILNLKYSLQALIPSQNLLGISLESPSRHLDGTTPFRPTLELHGGAVKTTAEKSPDPFCWQAPSSNAALYFADKWIEAHSFLKHRHTAAHHPLTQNYHKSRPKILSPKNPAWTEYVLDLMRTRGYFFHFPGLGDPSDTQTSPATALAIIHNELSTLPEENSQSLVATAARGSAADKPRQQEEEYLTSTSAAGRLVVENRLVTNLETLLPGLRPFKSMDKPKDDYKDDLVQLAMSYEPLTPLEQLPLLDYSGAPTTEQELRERAWRESLLYRRDGGGCSEQAAQGKSVVPGTADDLFCFDDAADAAAAEAAAQAAAAAGGPIPQEELPASNAPASAPAAAPAPGDLDSATTQRQNVNQNRNRIVDFGEITDEKARVAAEAARAAAPAQLAQQKAQAQIHDAERPPPQQRAANQNVRLQTLQELGEPAPAAGPISDGKDDVGGAGDGATKLLPQDVPIFEQGAQPQPHPHM